MDIDADYRRISNRKGSVWQYLYKFLTNPGFRAIFLYRIGKWFKNKNIKILPGLCQRIMLHTTYCSISLSANIGSGFLISHVGGIVIGGGTDIGAHCDIRQNVTFGGNYNKVIDGRSQPKVGDNVSFGVGSVMIGPINIGSNVVIGANSVVNRDISEGMIAFGMPAKEIKPIWEEKSDRGL